MNERIAYNLRRSRSPLDKLRANDGGVFLYHFRVSTFSWASKMKMIPLLFVVAAYGPAYATDTNMPLSEEALLAYASAPFDRVDKHIFSLGPLNGVPVIAEFICSDVCPDYTVRVIHYDLKKNHVCHEVGGVEKAVRIPVGIGATDKTFCFPRVLITNWGKYQKKLSYVPSGVGPHE